MDRRKNEASILTSPVSVPGLIPLQLRTSVSCDNIPNMKRLALLFASAAILVGCGGSSSDFSVLTTIPVITDASPNPVVRGSVLTINGAGFNGKLTTAQFASTTGTVTTATATSGNSASVAVTVPTTIAAGTYSLTVVDSTSQGVTSSPSNAISITLQ